MARMRSLTEPYIVSRAPDKIAAVVMSTTGATIAWTAVTAIGFISPAYESSAGQAGLRRSATARSGSPAPSGQDCLAALDSRASAGGSSRRAMRWTSMPDAPASWITRRRIGPPPAMCHQLCWMDPITIWVI